MSALCERANIFRHNCWRIYSLQSISFVWVILFLWGWGGAEGGGYRPINQPSAFSLSKHVAISASKDPLSVDLLKEFSWLIKIIIRFYIYASYK